METRWKNGSVGHAHGMESPTGLGVALIGMLQKKTKKLSEGASPAWYLLHCIPLLADTLHVPTSLGAQLQILEKGHSWWGKLKKKPTCFFLLFFSGFPENRWDFPPDFREIFLFPSQAPRLLGASHEVPLTDVQPPRRMGFGGTLRVEKSSYREHVAFSKMFARSKLKKSCKKR